MQRLWAMPQGVMAFCNNSVTYKQAVTQCSKSAEEAKSDHVLFQSLLYIRFVLCIAYKQS